MLPFIAAAGKHLSKFGRDFFAAIPGIDQEPIPGPGQHGFIRFNESPGGVDAPAPTLFFAIGDGAHVASGNRRARHDSGGPPRAGPID